MRKFINPVTVTIAFFVTIQLFSMLMLFIASQKDSNHRKLPPTGSSIDEANIVRMEVTDKETKK